MLFHHRFPRARRSTGCPIIFEIFSSVLSLIVNIFNLIVYNFRNIFFNRDHSLSTGPAAIEPLEGSTFVIVRGGRAQTVVATSMKTKRRTCANLIIVPMSKNRVRLESRDTVGRVPLSPFVSTSNDCAVRLRE